MNRWRSLSGMIAVLLFSIAGFVIMGYHPGAEDDAVYLSAVQANLHPALYPHDSAFFRLQMRASLFDTWMAAFVRITGIPVGWSALLWQVIALVLMFWASWSILTHLFEDGAARWAGMAGLSAMLTIPVSGSAIYIADQYLHPRNLTTALVLLAVAAILEQKKLQAIALLVVGSLLHPMMAAFGVSFCVFLALNSHDSPSRRLRLWRENLVDKARRASSAGALGAFVPFGWLLQPPAPGWIDAMRPRHCFWLYQWAWYEWLGAIGPLVLFWIMMRWARERDCSTLARFVAAVFAYGVFHQALAMIVCGPGRFVVLSTLEPMRYLQLVYIFMALIGGALLGRALPGARFARLAAFLIAAFGMFYVQRQLFPSSPHIEIPGQDTRNPWLQAFRWIRGNTPEDAYFALGPHYLTEPGEDMHSFRALAQRSTLADDVKDRAVLSKTPELAQIWQGQVNAQTGWNAFQKADFERLSRDFGVDWVVLDYAPPPGLVCPWRQDRVSVCRLP